MTQIVIEMTQGWTSFQSLNNARYFKLFYDSLGESFPFLSPPFEFDESLEEQSLTIQSGSLGAAPSLLFGQPSTISGFAWIVLVVKRRRRGGHTFWHFSFTEVLSIYVALVMSYCRTRRMRCSML